MKPADDIRKLFKKAELSIQPDADEQVFQDVLQARQKIKQNSTLTSSRWRMTMKNPITKLAAAAIIAVACIAGVVMWTGTGSGIALADVLTQVQQITAYMYQMTMTVRGGLANQDVKASILTAQDDRMRTITDMTDPNSGMTVRQEQYVLPQEKAVIVVVPSQKTYMRVDFDDTLLEQIRKRNNDPSLMLKQVLSCEYESLGRSTIDGAEVEGFQTTDPNYLSGMMGQADVKIWVAVKTQLPVRMEMNIETGGMKMSGVMDAFQWNCPVDATTFQPVIPADYKTLPGGPMKMPAMTEEGAVTGLKLFAGLFGQYPEKLDLMSLLTQVAKFRDSNDPAIDRNNPLFKQVFESGKGESVEEHAKKAMDIIMPIQGATLFYTLLVQEKKDPAYYGHVVTPQDADKVLLRWKLSDNQYRVIFGSLHAETVDAQTLAELEKNLPK